MTTYSHIARNKFRSFFLIFVFMGFIVLLGYAYGAVYGNVRESMIIALGIALFSTFFSYFFSDSIALAVNGAHKIEEKDDPELFHLVENTAKVADIPMPRVYVISDPSPNAFATGRNPHHAAIAVTTGLRQLLSKSELEGVLAHELSHIKNYDILFMTLVAVMVGTITMLADWFIRFGFMGGRGRERQGSANLVFVIIGIVLIILSPIIATLIQLAISRKREYLADSSGALLTRYPEGLANALEKIKSYGRPMLHANHATAHLFIANPLKVGKLNKLFATHPPIDDRIKTLREMNI